MASKKENYLEYIPAISEKNDWSVKDNKVTVHMVHRGFYATIAQKFFSKPRVSHIDLDTYGSFIWQQIDGKKNIEAIAKAFKEEFQDKAEPLYDRLIKYMQILKNNGFIYYVGKEKRK